MAKNIIQGDVGHPIHMIALPVTSPTSVASTTPASGAACAATSIPGIAENTCDAAGLTVMNTNCIAEIPVSGTNGGGNVAVAAGDLLYISATGVVSKVTTGVKFGTAIGAAGTGSGTINVRTGATLVVSGATTTIQVWVGKIN